jgi:4-pyridoxolactonase
MKLWNLDNGSIVIDHAQLMWNIGGGTPVRIPSYGVLIEHTDGLFLFDTGFDLEHTERVLPFEFPEQTVDQTIPAQLGRCGFKPEDVGTLVNTHLHFDHVGGNKHLTSSRIVLHEKELAHAREHEPFEFFGYSDKTWDYEGANFEPVSGDIELAKGIWLFETPGHTVGHYSLLLKPGGSAKPLPTVARRIQPQQPLQKQFCWLLAANTRANQQRLIAIKMLQRLVGRTFAQRIPISLGQQL